jgi:hypothetical protein
MSHTYTQNTVHLVFSTKDRRKLIPREFKPGSAPTSLASANKMESSLTQSTEWKITFIS